jgi:hypothetical protein
MDSVVELFPVPGAEAAGKQDARPSDSPVKKLISSWEMSLEAVTAASAVVPTNLPTIMASTLFV